MGWLRTGEQRRLEAGSQWEYTVEDLCGLMENYPKAFTVSKQREYASRAVSFVLSNLERRGIIPSQFIDIGEKEEVDKVTLFALMHEVDGKLQLAHRIKRVHSVYSSSVNNRPLVYNTYRKAELALEKTSTGNYLPEGTRIVELTSMDL